MFALICGLTVASFLSLFTPVQAQEATNLGDPASQAQTVLNDINSMRAQYGIAPLAFHPLLTTAAQAHVADMAANGNYSHYGTDGSSVYSRTARVGYGSANVSENWVAVGNAPSAIGWWMNSTIHRNNLLNAKWTHIGVGAQKDPRNGMWLFVAVFGTNGSSGGEMMAASAAAVTAGAPAAGMETTIRVPAGGMDYTVRPGDTLSGIAQRYGVNWEHIALINGLSEFSLLNIGQSIRVPHPDDLLPGIGGPEGSVQLPTSYIEYVIQPGDTLSGIAMRYKQDWRDVAAINGLGEHSVLELGSVVRIPSPAQAVLGEQAAAAAPIAPQVHTVAPGETVISIAQRYGIGWGDLLRANGLSENSIISIGQELKLP